VNYTELKTAVKDTVEIEIPDSILDTLTKQAEQLIYQSAQPPALRQNVTATATIGNKYLGLPTGFLYVFSLAAIKANGDYEYLLDKDVNFIRECYPDPADTGLPKHYALFDADTLILGPTPDAAYSMELHYAAYPESIVTAGTTWLGDAFDSALLNGTLIQAIRFTKGSELDLKTYETLYAQSLVLYKQFADGKLRQDVYRSGQARNEVR
jgi:hypothetical protein